MYMMEHCKPGRELGRPEVAFMVLGLGNIPRMPIGLLMFAQSKTGKIYEAYHGINPGELVGRFRRAESAARRVFDYEEAMNLLCRIKNNVRLKRVED